MCGVGRRPSPHPEVGEAGGGGAPEEERRQRRHADHPRRNRGRRRRLQLHGVQQCGKPGKEIHQHTGQRYDVHNFTEPKRTKK